MSICIADAIEDLRNQLTEARTRGQDTQGVKFSLSEVEVELRLLAKEKESDAGKVGVSFSVLGIGLSGGTGHTTEEEKTQTHTVRFKLEVTDAQTGGHIPLGRPGR